MSVIDFLIGKRIFIFDTETTGLPRKAVGGKQGTDCEYYPPDMHEHYNTARIVSIAWAYNECYNREVDMDILHHLRYPEGFTSIPTTFIHGISFNDAMEKGKPFNNIIDLLYDSLMNSDYIIAHNVMFDVCILRNELVRVGTERSMELLNHINTLIDNDRCICTGKLGMGICKILYKNSLTRYKMPRLSELYFFYYNNVFENAHSADNDVNALIKCLCKM